MKTGFLTVLAIFALFSTNHLSAQCPVGSVPSNQHVVQSGETLYRLSKQYKVSLGELCSWNNMTIYDTLKMCQMLYVQNPAQAIGAKSVETTTSKESWIPATYSIQNTPTVQTSATPATASGVSGAVSAPTTTGAIPVQATKKHVVQAGETMAQLAEYYGYTEKRFRQINAMDAKSEITPGSVLISTDCICAPLSREDGLIQTSTDQSSTTRPVQSQLIENRPTNTTAAPSSNTVSFSQLETDMLSEINLLRSNPAAYIPFIEKYQKETMIPASPSTVAELIAELRNTPTLSRLSSSECLYQAAKNHAESQRPKGDIDHQGTDGSWPWDRARNSCPSMKDGNENIVGGPSKVRNSVIILLLDEGIPTRGHRKTLLNKDWQYGACYHAGTVGSMPNCYVQMFGF
jgi:uncharacterized protein YkwD/LysM repeat protein